MNSILQNPVVDNLPGDELIDQLEAFLQPVLEHLPEKRLCDVAQVTVCGIVAARSPVLTEVASGVSPTEETIWPTAKRLYRFVWNKQFSHRDLLKGLYGIAQCAVARYAPPRLLVALDTVSFEKPYTRKSEGVSTVLKSTPPGERGQKRLTPGYPAMTATAVNLPEPVDPETLPIRRACWHPKQETTFSDALAAVRRHLWHSMNCSTSAQDNDMLLIPHTTLFSLLEVACYST